MKKEEIQALFSQFEQVSCVLNDVECCSARDLCTLLGYTEWRNFMKVIEKAKNACSNVGHNITDHFVDVNKMVVLGSGAELLIAAKICCLCLIERALKPPRRCQLVYGHPWAGTSRLSVLPVSAAFALAYFLAFLPVMTRSLWS